MPWMVSWTKYLCGKKFILNHSKHENFFLLNCSEIFTKSEIIVKKFSTKLRFVHFLVFLSQVYTKLDINYLFRWLSILSQVDFIWLKLWEIWFLAFLFLVCSVLLPKQVLRSFPQYFTIYLCIQWTKYCGITIIDNTSNAYRIA